MTGPARRRHRGWGRGLLGALLLAVAAVSLAIAATAAPPTAAERAQQLDAELRCPVCQGLSVADSQSSTARAIADDVARRVAAGESDEQIRQAYVARYGPGILLAPAGVPGAVAVGLPVALVAAAAAGVALALRRRGRSRPADARDEELVARLRADHTARAAGAARSVDRSRAADRSPGAARPDRPRRATTRAARATRPPSRRRRLLVAVVAALALGGLGATGAVVVLRSPPTTGQAGDPPSLAALRRAVAQHPGDAAAHDALADALAQNGDLTGALKEFEAAAAADPKDVVALSYAGWIALLGGAPDKALDRLGRAEAVDPAYPDAHAFRGIALLRAGGDRAEAAAELQRYLQLAPDGPMDQQVRDVLDQLQALPRQPTPPAPGP